MNVKTRCSLIKGQYRSEKAGKELQTVQDGVNNIKNFNQFQLRDARRPVSQAFEEERYSQQKTMF